MLAHGCRRRADLKTTRHAKPLHATNTVRDVKQTVWEREGIIPSLMAGFVGVGTEAADGRDGVEARHVVRVEREGEHVRVLAYA